MRKLCTNYDREDGLETVLEVPIPEEMFASTNKHTALSWQSMKSWIKSPNSERSHSSMTALFGTRNAEIQLLLGVVGAPLIPLPISCDHQPINRNIKDHPIVSQTHQIDFRLGNLFQVLSKSLVINFVGHVVCLLSVTYKLMA